MKKYTIELVVLCVLITVFIFGSFRTPTVVENNTQSSQKEDLCFEERFRAPQASIPEGMFDQTILLLRANDDFTTGVYSWIPYGKDSGRGLIKGGFVDENKTLWKGIYTYSIEGSVEKSEVIFLLKEGNMFVGDGVRVSDPATQVLRFRDSSILRFEKKLVSVDCASIASQASLIPPNLPQ